MMKEGKPVFAPEPKVQQKVMWADVEDDEWSEWSEVSEVNEVKWVKWSEWMNRKNIVTQLLTILWE
jgi:hypothetical protein